MTCQLMSKRTLHRDQHLPFMAYSLALFFSLTRYTLPTSPLPINLILSKLLGPTSTFLTLMLLLLYVRLKATLFLILPGLNPLIPGTGRAFSPFCGNVSTMLSALELLCEPTPFGIFGGPSDSAVPGLLSLLPPLPLLNMPCALGALATLLSFLASSSFPLAAAMLLASSALPVSGATFGDCGVSGGEGGTLLSL